MMIMKSVIWWRNPEYPEETTDLRQVTDETFHVFSTMSPFAHMISSPSRGARVKVSSLSSGEFKAIGYITP